jgi:serine/threonine protein kinase
VRESPLDDSGWIGRVLHDRYRIEAPLGEGGLGVVFRATHLGIGRPVAVKVLHRDLLPSPAIRKRFEREVETLSRLAHPHIVTLTDSGVLDDGAGYLVMELLEGESLRALIDRGPIPASDAIPIVRQILLGLEDAHRRGVLHRDIKPANVFLLPLADGGTHVKILDFGLAKVRNDAATDGVAYPTLTADGTIVGTPTYMPPEQAVGASVDASADLYALAVVLFEMLTGSPPFTGETKLEVVRAHLEQTPPELDEVWPALSPAPELRELIKKALAKEREGRFESASEMRAALDALPEPAATIGGPARKIKTASPHDDTMSLTSNEVEAVAPESEAPPPPRPPVRAPPRAAPARRAARPRGRVRMRPIVWGVVIGTAALFGGVAAWKYWPGDLLQEIEVADGGEPAPPPDEGGTNNPFRPGELPADLLEARRAILRGRALTDRQARDLSRYQREHPDDSRPLLLLARHSRFQGQWTQLVRHYRNAYGVDPAVVGFTPMLTDLVRAVEDPNASRAASRLIGEAFGRDALVAVDAALQEEGDGPVRRRLERLQRELRELPEN